VRKHPRGGTIEKYARSLGARPAKRIDPSGQTKPYVGISEFAIAIAGTDFFNMSKALPLVVIARQAIQVCDIELSSNRMDHRLRQARRIVLEAPQKTHSGELQGKPQPVGRAKRSPTGFRSRLGQAPSSVAAIVSYPSDEPIYSRRPDFDPLSA
jgi:hypothetical protein